MKYDKQSRCHGAKASMREERKLSMAFTFKGKPASYARSLALSINYVTQGVSRLPAHASPMLSFLYLFGSLLTKNFRDSVVMLMIKECT